MGELFRQILPETHLPWTGERMVPGQTGAIEAEHFHRYFLARELCRGKDVLDVACGEGYGSAFLAQTARDIVGVELDPTTVEHATREYRSHNLRYIQGEATKLPVGDNSVDAVVSFETIEHVSDHEVFLAEVKRVLRPDGFLIISTPDVNVYSAPGTASNPFHVREMTEAEFRAKLGAAFRTVSLVRQRAMTGSAILPDAIDAQTTGMSIYEQRDSNTFESDRKLLRAPFLLAVASDRAVPPIGVSLYIGVTDVPLEVKTELERLRRIELAAREQAPILATAASNAINLPPLLAELERLRRLEESIREQAPIVAKAMGDAAALPTLEAELVRLRNTDIPGLQAELERLRGVETAARDQAPIFAKLEAELVRLRNTDIPGLQAELERLRGVETAARNQAPIFAKAISDAASAQEEASKLQEQNRLLTEKSELAQDHAVVLQEQLTTSLLVARQQALAAQRAQKELLSVREEMLSAKADAETYRSAYQQAAGLIVPLRLRQSLPEPVKRLFRMLKRAGQ